MRHSNWRFVLGVAAIIVSAGGVIAAQATKTTEVKQFEIISVDGQKVVVKGDEGAKEISVNEDFRLTVDGQPVALKDLKPGMKGTARITTTTTVVPVQVTEVKNGEVVKVAGTSVIVRTPEGNKMFSEPDVAKRGVKISVDGRPVKLSELREGTKLTATIVTTKPPRVMTQREVEAALQAAPVAAPPVASAPAAPRPAQATPAPAMAAPVAPDPRATAAPTTAGTTATPAATSGRQLPKTASPLPFIGLVGVAFSAVGLLLTGRRRRGGHQAASR
jgi:LPXTG-motif cell wall-anchored protein